MSKFLAQVAEYSATPLHQIMVDHDFESEATMEAAIRELFLTMSDYLFAHTLGCKGLNRPLNLVETAVIVTDKFDGLEDALSVYVFEEEYEDAEERLQNLYGVREAEDNDEFVVRGSIPTPSLAKEWEEILAHEGLGLIR